MQTDLVLFGFDLSRIWAPAREAGLGLVRAVVRALSPELPVNIITAQNAANNTNTTPKKARYRALVLPEELLLRRKLVLPASASQEVNNAVALDVRTHSPFAAEDKLWVAHTQNTDSRLQVEWALGSRTLIQQYLLDHQIDTNALEVRVPFGTAHQTFKGFGEGKRQRETQLIAGLNGFLILCSLAWLAAMALTPSAQLYLQAQQARQSLEQLGQQAKPVLPQREALLRTHDKAQQLQEFIQSGTPALENLVALTQATPDDTFLNTLRLEGSSVRMVGQTTNATELMKKLGNVPGISEVKAPSPSTKPPGAVKEVFNVELHLRAPAPNEQAKEAPPSATAFPKPADSAKKP